MGEASDLGRPEALGMGEEPALERGRGSPECSWLLGVEPGPELKGFLSSFAVVSGSDLEISPGFPNPSISFRASVPRATSPLLSAMVVRRRVLPHFLPNLKDVQHPFRPSPG